MQLPSRLSILARSNSIPVYVGITSDLKGIGGCTIDLCESLVDVGDDIPVNAWLENRYSMRKVYHCRARQIHSQSLYFEYMVVRMQLF